MNDIVVKKNIIWRILQQYSSYIIKIIVQIVLARLLLPEDFGLIAIVMVFVNIAEIIAISGFGTALVQKKDPDYKDFSTVLTSSMVFSFIAYFAVFLFAPVIADIYHNEKLILVLRVYGIAIFIQSYFSIQNALVAKKFQFKKSFIATLLATIISGAISIFAAYSGVGIWALVIQSICASVLSVIILHFLVPWVPKFGFDFERFKMLFSFSWKILLASLLGSVLEDLYNLVIGKFYGEEMLGYYKQGNSYPSAILGQTKNAINAVILPAYSIYQNDKERLRLEVKKMTHLSVFLIFPMALGLAAISRNFVLVILTEKWLPCLFFLRLECIFFATLPLASSINMAMTAIGRSDIALKLESIKLLLSILCVIFLHSVDIEFLCIARVAIAVFVTLLSVFVSNKQIGYGFKDLFIDIYKPLLISFLMGVIVFMITFIGLSEILTLIMQVLAGLIIYFICAYMFMKNDLRDIRLLFSTKQKEEQQ